MQALNINTDNKYIESNFKKVRTFNAAFDMVSTLPKEYIGYTEDQYGYIKLNPMQYCRKHIFDSHSTIRLRLNLIKEELTELNDAIKQNDRIETRDACADILYVVYGMADVLGIDIDYIFSDNIHSIVLKHCIDHDQSYSNKIMDNIILSYNILNISNFKYVKIFINEILGSEISTKYNKSDAKFVKLVLAKLNGLYNELEANCEKDCDLDEKFKYVSYNIFELLKWTYVMTIAFNVNADSDFAIVHDSNMSKLCDSEDDAKATVADYEAKYKSGNSPYDSPYYYYLSNLNKWIVKNKSSGKALKNIKYKQVSFGNERFVF